MGYSLCLTLDYIMFNHVYPGLTMSTTTMAAAHGIKVHLMELWNMCLFNFMFNLGLPYV